MAKPEDEEDDSVDLILRHVSHLFPEELARGLLGADSSLTAAVFETQVTSRHRALDRTLDVRVDGHRRLLHVEWQGHMPVDMPFRTYEYQVLLGLAVAGERRGGIELVPPIESVVVLLAGREEPWPAYGSYRLSPQNAPFSGVHFRIEPVYQRTVAELEAMESPFWMIFAPLAVDADERGLQNSMKRLRARVSSESYEELGVAMAVLAEADGRERGLRNVVRSLLPRELVMQSQFLKEMKELFREEGRREGREAGLAEARAEARAEALRPLVHLVERRLDRVLSAGERDRLAERMQQDGAERVGDAVLDLAPEDLAAWIAPTNGH
jgi:hypothetical protein